MFLSSLFPSLKINFKMYLRVLWPYMMFWKMFHVLLKICILLLLGAMFLMSVKSDGFVVLLSFLFFIDLLSGGSFENGVVSLL